MTFYAFMMRNYLNEDSAEGDLAADMKREEESFPEVGADGYDEVYRYLLRHHACFQCLEVFDRCWKEYALE